MSEPDRAVVHVAVRVVNLFEVSEENLTALKRDDAASTLMTWAVAWLSMGFSTGVSLLVSVGQLRPWTLGVLGALMVLGFGVGVALVVGSRANRVSQDRHALIDRILKQKPRVVPAEGFDYAKLDRSVEAIMKLDDTK